MAVNGYIGHPRATLATLTRPDPARPATMDDDFTRYLLAKRSVDDRALNRGVLEALLETLRPDATAMPRVLELGGGLGTMVVRLYEWGVLRRAHYTLFDRDGRSLARASDHLERWARGQGLGVRRGRNALCLGEDLRVELRQGTVEALGETPASQPTHDLVMAHALLDLVDVPALLPRLWSLAPGGAYWFTLNFDGETLLSPEHPLDAEVARLYHRSMDQREARGRGAGHSRTGRRLLTQLPESGASIEAAGSSDWVVWPRAGGYPGDEAHFLEHLVHTIELELQDEDALDRRAFAHWVAERRRQIEAAALCYVAHQLDFAGRIPGGAAAALPAERS